MEKNIKAVIISGTVGGILFALVQSIISLSFFNPSAILFSLGILIEPTIVLWILAGILIGFVLLYIYKDNLANKKALDIFVIIFGIWVSIFLARNVSSVLLMPIEGQTTTLMFLLLDFMIVAVGTGIFALAFEKLNKKLSL